MPSPPRPLRDALAHRGLRAVTVAFGSLTLGEWLLGTAAALAVYDLGGPIAVGLVGARFVPAAIASLATAELGAGRSAAAILTAVAASRACVAAAVAFALWTDLPAAALIALVWVDAAVGAAYRPAQARLLPTLASTPTELTAAAALGSIAKSVGQVGGALLGAAMVALAGGAAAAGAAAFLCCVSTASAFGLRPRAPHAAAVPRGGRAGAFEHARAGIGAIAENSAARRIAAWACARSGLRGVWTSLGVVASLTVLGMGPAGYGLLMAAAGGGTLAGVLVTSRIAIRAHVAGALAWSLGTAAVALVIVGALASAQVAVAVMLVWGAGMAVADLTAQALLVRVVPPSQSARVVAAMEAGKLAAEGLGALAAPVLAELFGLRATLAAAGLFVMAALLADRSRLGLLDRAAEGRSALLELAHGVPLFRALQLDGLEAVVAPLRPVAVSAGTTVIEQDTLGEEWYLVRSGEFEVRIDGFPVGRAAVGDSFGERGLLRAEQRSATVIASVDGELLVLGREDFLRAVTGTDALGPAAVQPHGLEPADAVAQLHLLSALEPGERRALAEGAQRLSVATGDTLFAQGQPDDRYLVVLEGRIQILVDGRARRTLGPGDDLGEIAVLHRVPRTAAAVASTPASLLAIDGDALRAALAATAPPAR